MLEAHPRKGLDNAVKVAVNSWSVSEDLSPNCFHRHVALSNDHTDHQVGEALTNALAQRTSMLLRGGTTGKTRAKSARVIAAVPR